MIWVWTAIGVAVAAYCIVTGVMFLRQKRHVWGVAGIVLGLAVLFMPVPGVTGPVKIDLPAR
ncbi:MAG: hypothetical protein EOO77_15120 [Oxalobacteraceae bacterium]|nr:MAG: hypothetical protein EOO77_15120 [Oxalobacteraceae bacterium]